MEGIHKRDITVYYQHHTKHLLYSMPITACSRVEIRRPEPPIRNYEELSQLCDVINLKHAVLTILATNAQGRKRLHCTVTAAYSTAMCEVAVYNLANSEVAVYYLAKCVAATHNLAKCEVVMCSLAKYEVAVYYLLTCEVTT
jgi:hypothetical protein